MSNETKKGPSNFGEWDQAIAATAESDLLEYRKALQTLKEWEPFQLAFAWTRVFILIDSIDHAIRKRG